MIYTKKSGYILTLTLLLIFLSMFLVVYIANKGSIFVPYANIAIEQKQSYVLAQGGVALAVSQIVSPKVAKKEQEKGKKPTQEDRIKDMLTIVLPSLNQWQEVNLKEEIDGIDGKIRFCIMSEDGKIDLNAFYDFEKGQFIDTDKTQNMFKELFEKIKAINGSDLLGAFEKMFKDRKFRFNDPTELLTKEFASFKDHIFYEPSEGKDRKIYLTDLFTVWTGKRSLNPWLLSDSMSVIFGLTSKDVAERKKMVAQWLKPFKLNAQWQSEWDKLLKPLYGKEFNSIPKSLQPLLNSTFEANLFSVLSYATVGRVTTRLLAIVECPKSGQSTDITLKKVYWL